MDKREPMNIEISQNYLSMMRPETVFIPTSVPERPGHPVVY